MWPFVISVEVEYSLIRYLSRFGSLRFGSPLFGKARFGSALFGSALFGSPPCDGFGDEFGLSFLVGVFFCWLEKGEVAVLNRFKTMLWWLLTNDIDLAHSAIRETYFESLRELEFGISRTAELRKYAEEEFKERTAGMKEANERLDKLLGLTLVAIGWVGTHRTQDAIPRSLVILLLAAIVLLCGRWKVTSRLPSTFPDFVHTAMQSGKDETPKFEFDVARQYHKAAYDNGELTQYTQLRLLIAAAILIAGLIAFALRV